MSVRHPQSTSFWLEFRVLSDGLETAAVQALPLAAYHAAQNPVFTLFPMLPAELRLKIWEYLIAPRIVGVGCLCQDESSPPVEEQHKNLWGPWDSISNTSSPRKKTSPIPVLLHVNHETRELALKHYELSFEWKVPRVLAGMDLYHHSEPPPGPNPGHSPPRTWFNFHLDAIYLVGELEPCDSFGFNSPMSYFVSSRDSRRVRTTAIAFRALRYGETGGQQIFGALFHVVDRFVPHDGRVFVAITEDDEVTHAMMGNEERLIPVTVLALAEKGAGELDGIVGAAEGEGSWNGNGTGSRNAPFVRAHDLRRRKAEIDSVNAVQKIWREWYRGALINAPLAQMEFVLVREDELEGHVYDSAISGSAKEKAKVKKSAVV
ncbi:hypothetical protein F5Y16DRAFT_105882 [Xylariaceae sp. FL0255]|nr:hypothetical protein F5Y16DRAFT_105882 [Xylariaceae sp. FL0255]